MIRRTLVTLLIVIGVTLGILLVLNPAGWRARLLARVFRSANPAVMVTPPTSFQPQVPAGFRVSMFARGFEEPRWMAVAPNGDVFVADSAAGKVIVLHAAEEQPIAGSRETFADHLNLPFGIASMTIMFT